MSIKYIVHSTFSLSVSAFRILSHLSFAAFTETGKITRVIRCNN